MSHCIVACAPALPMTSTLRILRHHLPFSHLSPSTTICRKKFNPLPTNTIRAYTTQILEGLQYLHTQGIVHRGCARRCGGNGDACESVESRCCVVHLTSSWRAAGCGRFLDGCSPQASCSLACGSPGGTPDLCRTGTGADCCCCCCRCCIQCSFAVVDFICAELLTDASPRQAQPDPACMGIATVHLLVVHFPLFIDYGQTTTLRCSHAVP